MTAEDYAKLIPDEAVEKAAMAAYAEWVKQVYAREATNPDMAGEVIDDLCPFWEDMSDEMRLEWMAQARAACAAMLASWPNIRMMVDIETGDDAALKLPLPQEGGEPTA
jgi:hypothetical protein